MNDLVSICIPTYNSAAYLADTLNSYIGQTYKNIEIIVVSDGCTDSTPILMDYYLKKDGRVKYFYRKKNKGIAFTRNECVALSSGKYIAVADSDDVADPDRIKKSVKAIEGHDFVFTPYLQANQDGQAFGVYNPPSKATIEHVLDGDWPHVTIMARRECFVDNPYRQELTVNDDSGLLLDWYKAGYKAKKINRPLMMVRYHDKSVSVRKKKKADFILAKLKKELAEYLNE